MPSPDDVAFLQYTSGSLSQPKGVMVTHRAVLANERMIRTAFGHDESTVFCSWLPLFHDMGLVGGLLQPLYLGISCYVMTPLQFLARPQRWLQAISRYRATTSGAPNFAYDYCVDRITPEQREGLNLRSWRVAFNGAEPVSARTLRFDGVDLLAASDAQMGRLRGSRLSMIMQDPKYSLNPVMTVGAQIAEGVQRDRRLSRAEATGQVHALLQRVHIREPQRVAAQYAHQLSGGMGQRVMIAMMLAQTPQLLVADEPTSALDVSVQAQVLNIMKDVQRSHGLTYLFISHNLAVVRHVADQVGVMYLGRLVELADKATVFSAPRHPYTRMLLDAIPDIHMSGRSRTPVQGEVPNPLNPPSGCAFHPRCPHANARCTTERPRWQPLQGIHIACHAVEEGRI